MVERKELCGEEPKNTFSSNAAKSVSEEIFSALKHMLNLSINQGVFPENMKIAFVTPIFKSRDEYLLTNYKPISVLPCFSKILERIM